MPFDDRQFSQDLYNMNPQDDDHALNLPTPSLGFVYLSNCSSFPSLSSLPNAGPRCSRNCYHLVDICLHNSRVLYHLVSI